MLSAFSQCAMLHQKGERVRLDRLKSVLKMFLSTSPNLPMVASLDVARKQMATEGDDAAVAHDRAGATRRASGSTRSTGSTASAKSMRGRNGVFDLDPTKIAVTVKGLGYTGYEASEILRRRYNIQVELADLFNVVALFTIGTTPEAADRLVDGLRRAGARRSPGRYVRAVGNTRTAPAARRVTACRRFRRCACSRARRFSRDTEFVKFKDSKGRICAETISPYPPGIPVIAPGEEITGELIDYLRLEMKAGVRIQGPYDDELKTVRVVVE